MKNKTNTWVPVLVLCVLSLCLHTRVWGKEHDDTPLFAENKGQLKDQFQKQRNDISYYGSSDGMSYYFKNGGVSYQLYKQGDDNQVAISRVDMQWLGANPAASMITENKSGYTENYYQDEGTGITGVRHFGDLRYKALYQGIDLHYYYKGASLKYDFEVAARADYKQIRIKLEGATALTLEKDGSISIATPNGIIKEAPPVAYQGAKEIPSAWVVKDKVLSFELSNYDPSRPVVIDPLVFHWKKNFGSWGGMSAVIYYTDAVAPDDYGNIYMAYTSAYWSVGGNSSGQNTLSKMSSSTGVEYTSWPKYIQTITTKTITEGCTISNNYIYVSGYTTSGVAIATTGAYQTTFNPGYDCFIAKYDSSGTKIWGTLYGGSGDDSTLSSKTDALGNIYLCGLTRSVNAMAGTGAYQPAIGGASDAFIAKFDSNGMRVWGTYFGGNNIDVARGLALKDNRVFIAGFTSSATNIAISGMQPALSGAQNAFLLCMDTSGAPQWSTYYGADSTWGTDCAVNGNHVYLTGATNAAVNISTPGTHQPVKGQGKDAFLVKFDMAGVRQWGTYLGGAGDDVANSSAAGKDGYIYICGNTFSDTGIVTFPSYNSVYTPLSPPAGVAYLVEFDSSGQRSYGSYLNNGAIAEECAVASNGDVVVVGEYADYYDDYTGFITKFSYCNTPRPVITATATHTCSNVPVTLSVTPLPGATYKWYRNGGLLSGGNSNVYNTVQPGTYKIAIGGCPSGISDTIVITTSPAPTVQATHTDVPCYGAAVATITTTTTGGTLPYIYAWGGLADTTASLTGLGPGTYVVQVSDSSGCQDTDTIIVLQKTEIEPSNPLASICAVTVDSATGNNLVVWEKTGTVKAVSYNVYRESSVGGLYDLIGTVSVDEPGTYLDNTAVPLQQSYSYKIAEVDSCDKEWPLSALHKTIHLSANVGTGGELNLIWNAYEGMAYATHFIERSNNGGDYVLLNQVSASTLSYSDLTPPAGTNRYRIYIDVPAPCVAAAGLTFQRVASNVVVLNPTGISDPSLSAGTRIVPNPTKGMLMIAGSTPARICVYDLAGKALYNEKYTGKLDISGYAKGVYHICLFNKDGQMYYNQKVILE